VNFSIIILALWESFAVTFQFALVNGGPASMLYGSILAGLGACGVGFSLAELALMYVFTTRIPCAPTSNTLIRLSSRYGEAKVILASLVTLPLEHNTAGPPTSHQPLRASGV
jgi:hypothetical protein